MTYIDLILLVAVSALLILVYQEAGHRRKLYSIQADQDAINKNQSRFNAAVLKGATAMDEYSSDEFARRGWTRGKDGGWSI